MYLQGSSVGNEKITGSCLPADVKAVWLAFSCAAFTQVTGLNYRVKPKTIISNQGNWGNVSLVAVVGSRKGFHFKSLNLKKLLLLK